MPSQKSGLRVSPDSLGLSCQTGVGYPEAGVLKHRRAVGQTVGLEGFQTADQ